MSVPDFQSIMLPLLRILADGREHSTVDVYDGVANAFNLTDPERRELVPSGKMTKLVNRVAWAKTYLIKAGLLDAPHRGKVTITARGRELLGENPSIINIAVLSRYPEFVQFRTKAKVEGPESQPDNGSQAETPDELLESAYQQLRGALAVELLDRVKQATPAFFEKLVVELLVAMGYGGSLEDAGEVVGKSGDEGIDGLIKEDRLGLDVIYLQAKRWETVVGRPEIQKFVGALQGQRAKKGVFVATSSFSDDAKRYAASIDSKIVLIDGQRLAEYMIDFGIGVSTVNTYTTKRLDSDYFTEE